MAKNIVVFSTVVVFLFSVAYATPGIATFYTSYTPSACYGGAQEGVMIAAASDKLWDNGRVCGKYFTVKCTGPRNPVPHPVAEGVGFEGGSIDPRNPVPHPCTGKSVRVKIVDHCPGGCPSTLDLSKEAFAEIANPVAGIINIDYIPA